MSNSTLRMFSAFWGVCVCVREKERERESHSNRRGSQTRYLGLPDAATILAQPDVGLRLPALETGLGTRGPDLRPQMTTERAVLEPHTAIPHV